jgi:hypothetical protein
VLPNSYLLEFLKAIFPHKFFKDFITHSFPRNFNPEIYIFYVDRHHYNNFDTIFNTSVTNNFDKRLNIFAVYILFMISSCFISAKVQ